MRQIKFRAWDKSGDGMFANIHNGIDFDDGSHYPFNQFLNPFTDDSHDWVVMQSTGLKDKNGKEVYEGDIVLCERDERCPHEVIWAEDNGGTFFGGMPGFNLSGLKRNCGSGYAWSGDEEVIGNIYENPELLQ